MDAIFFPGIGGSSEGWPTQAAMADDDRRLHFIETSAMPEGPERHAEYGLGLVEGDLHVVGHSYGGNAAIMAAGRAKGRIKSLALFEPTVFSIAGNLPATAATVETLQGIWDEYSGPGTPDGVLAARFFENVHGQIDPEHPMAAQAGANLRAWGSPWAHTLDLSVISEVPTLVVTGAWSDTYEEMAQVLAEAGARHVQIKGHDHNPQNDPRANDILKELWESA